MLSPNTNPARNQWAALMEEQLQKIGIGIAFHESTGWGNIMPRVWAYPVGNEGYYDYIQVFMIQPVLFLLETICTNTVILLLMKN
ncbi:MAG: hypothetical protein ACTSQ6_11055 [Candidatus Heimdallarchaeaceae archaeon]